MNKIIIALSALLFSSANIYAQQLLTTAGSQQGDVSWSIGEMITEVGVVSDMSIYQGFNGVEVNVQTGLSDAPSYGLSVFPNPVIDKLIINIDADAGFTYRLTDLVGRVLVEGKARSERAEVDMSSYASGQYILQVYTTQFSKSTIILKK